LLWLFIVFCSVYYDITIYLARQSYGQFYLLTHTQSFAEYEVRISEKQKQNLRLIDEIKKYSVDSLNYSPTENFTKIYDQKDAPLLWVITASSPYKVEPYYWKFPVVGEVSYKGFFDKQKAIALKNKLIGEGYDVDLRSVSAWSTLGWFSDPVLSNMLNKSKGNLCELIFHELFHATYYAESSVEFNENLATFIAFKATIRFLQKDTAELRSFLNDNADDWIIYGHAAEESDKLKRFYDSISDFRVDQKSILKLQRMTRIAISFDQLDVNDKERLRGVKKHILEFKNAWFVSFDQYGGLQDSLEEVFNKFYHADLAKMVQSLK
jgi:predicted aminopeptidase